MPDFEDAIRTSFRAEAAAAPPPRGLTPATVRRARAKRLVADASFGLTIVVILGALTIGLLQLGGRTPGPAAPTTSPASAEGGTIAFVRWGVVDAGIYAMNGDGSHVDRILGEDYPYAIDQPAWSPDGRRIAFHGFYGGAANEAGGLFVVNVDGSDLEEIAAAGTDPSWSPDGEQIAFATNDGAIDVIDADGSRRYSLGPGSSPSWSPVGRQIAFARKGIYVVNASGNATIRRVVGVTNGSYPSDPQWSPDGSRIAFAAATSDRHGGAIYVVDDDGSNRSTLTAGGSPTWSPDGTRIAFERTDGKKSRLFSINLDGTGLHELTAGPSDHSPAWVGAEVDRTAAQGDCPELVPPRPHDERPVTDEASRWAFQHMPNKVRSYGVHVERARGEVMGPCDAQTWRRSWVATIHWHYRKGTGGNNSASLASSTIFVGRATNGKTVVWFQFH